MRQILILTLITLLASNCSDNNGSTENKSISERVVKEDLKIPIDKSDYTNFFAFKNSDTNYVFGKIRSGDKHFGNPDIKEYSVDFFKKGDWTLLKLDTAFSLLFYHSLIMWIDGLDSDVNIPKPTLGISLHKTDKTKNYSFVVGNYYQRQDMEVGIFENGTPFFIYVPNAWADKGNIYTGDSLTLKEKNINDFFKTYDFPFNADSLSKLTFRPLKIKVK